jgi:hypothetical protein
MRHRSGKQECRTQRLIRPAGHHNRRDRDRRDDDPNRGAHRA